MKAYGKRKRCPLPTRPPKIKQLDWLTRTYPQTMLEFGFHGSVEVDDRREKHMQKAGVSECLLHTRRRTSACKRVGVIVWDGLRWVAATYRQTVFVWMEIWDGPLGCWSIGSRSFQFLSISLIFPPAERDAGICLPAFSLLNPAQQPTSTPPDSPLWTLTAG